MAWVFLFMAGIFEIGFAAFLKLSEGFTRIWPIVGFLVCSILSLGLLSKAMKFIPLGTAYAVWTGIGAVGTVLIGFIVFKDPISFGRIFFLSLIFIAIVGLKVVTPLD